MNNIKEKIYEIYADLSITKNVFISLVAMSFLILSMVSLFKYLTVLPQIEILNMQNETRQMASLLFFEKMSTLVQLTVGTLGVVWAYVFLTDNRVDVSNPGAKICFALSTLSFLVSLFIYAAGYDKVIESMFKLSAFDIDAPSIQFVKNYQYYFFIHGVFAFATTLFIGYKRNEN